MDPSPTSNNVQTPQSTMCAHPHSHGMPAAYNRRRRERDGESNARCTQTQTAVRLRSPRRGPPHRRASRNPCARASSFLSLDFGFRYFRCIPSLAASCLCYFPAPNGPGTTRLQPTLRSLVATHPSPRSLFLAHLVFLSPFARDAFSACSIDPIICERRAIGDKKKKKKRKAFRKKEKGPCQEKTWQQR